MATLFPFRALRPSPSAAPLVASVPYDVVSADEARAMVHGRPLNFLHVTRSEIDLPPSTPPYDASVYAQAVRNFETLKRDAPLLLDDEPSIYLYRVRMGGHEQTGVAACFSVDEYERGLIKKHEKTRKDKEDDRTRHITELRAQTGVVFLTYRASPAVDVATARAMRTAPVYDFAAEDGVTHTMWRVTGAEREAVVAAFANVPALYIADGHHRAASAARACTALNGAGESSRFIAVAFPDAEMQILPYHRVVKDLAGATPAAFLTALQSRLTVGAGRPVPSKRGEVSMFLDGVWHRLTLPPAPAGSPRDETLDVAVLHREVLEPLLKVGDPRVDKRIDFVGGVRGTGELERRVTSGAAAVAFSMFPVTVEDLLAIADAGGLMPPKSTWFEPKLRDGLLVHLI